MVSIQDCSYLVRSRMHDVDIVWKPEDWGDFPIAINEPGSYIVQAEFEDKSLSREFIVAST